MTKPPAHSPIHIEVLFFTLKVSELREQLSARKMDTSGLKNQLSNRLKVALQNEAEEEERKKSKLNCFFSVHARLSL